MLVLSGMHVLNTISNINISEAQRQAKPTPSEPILPPKPSVDYHVDESVRACKVESSSVLHMLLMTISFSCTRNKNHKQAQNYGESLWGKTAKVVVELPSAAEKIYFLKVSSPRNDGFFNC